jgi:non-specific serine/threonine protein kinase
MSQVKDQIPGTAQHLTARETEVAVLLAEGLGSSEIAARLSIAPSSVKWYLRQVFHKLGVHTREDAGLRARQLGLSVPAGTPTEPAPRPFGAVPQPSTSFVGRERETAALMSWLEAGRSRLLTVTGTAGSGKTRLVLNVAAKARLVSHLQVCWTDLTATADPQLIGSTIASALGVFIKPGQSEMTAIAEHFGNTPALLVLDNCEHLARDCTKASGDLLAGCAGLRVIVTSRVPLPVEGAKTWLLDPLPVPASEELPPGEIAASESVRLFSERASVVVPGFAVTGQNAVAVARVCRRLDGLPLAIELAASRVRLLTTAQLAERLEGALRLLAGGGSVGALRHATLRGALDWSHGLLTPAEQALFRRLAVFAGGWGLEDAEAVCPGGILEPADVLPGLSELVDQSLVVVERPSGGTRRFRLLEVIRQYADDRLRAADERSVLRRSHGARFAALAREARGELNGPRQPAWTLRLEQDVGNLRAAMAWGLDVPEGLEPGAEIACTLSQVWQLHGEFAEGLMWHRRYLAASHAIPRRVQADLHESTGFLAVHAGLGAEARSHWEEAAALFAEIDDPAAVGRQLHFLAHATMGKDAPRAAALAARGLALEQEAGDLWWTSACLFALGDASFLQGDVAKAADCYEKSQELARRLGHAFAIARRCVRLGQVARTRGDLDAARQHLGEAMRVAKDGSDDWGVTMALAAWGSVAAAVGSPRTSAMLLGAAQGRLDQYGAVLWALDRAEFARTSATAGALVGEDAFREGLGTGRTLTPPEIDSLVRELVEPEAKEPLAGPPVRLTAREAQVLHLIAAGQSNQSIATGLGLSVRTVERHTANLYMKLGVEGPAARTAAANYAFRHGMGPEQDALAVGH